MEEWYWFKLHIIRKGDEEELYIEESGIEDNKERLEILEEEKKDYGEVIESHDCVQEQWGNYLHEWCILWILAPSLEGAIEKLKKYIKEEWEWEGDIKFED